MKNLKMKFIKDLANIKTPRVISVMVKLPSGAIEVITNFEDTENKTTYYVANYDDHFKLKHNPNIQIINYMMM